MNFQWMRLIHFYVAISLSLVTATNFFTASGVPATTTTTNDAPTVILITGALRPPGFTPSILTVHVNQSIVFINSAYPTDTFTIVANDNSFSSPAIAPQQQWTTSFAQTGSYSYHESSHPTSMVGTIFVVTSSVHLIQPVSPATQQTAINNIRNQQITSSGQHSTSGIFVWIIVALVILAIGVSATIFFRIRMKGR